MLNDAERMLAYIRIKWYILLGTTLTIVTTSFFGAIDYPTLGFSFLGIGLSALWNIILYFVVKRGKCPPWLPFVIIFFDLLTIIFVLYFNGGPENTWWFLPVFLIFLSGYVFSSSVSILSAAIAMTGIISIFLLEYFGLIPHYSIYKMTKAMWGNRAYMTDYILGMFLLYSSGAIISIYFNVTTRKSADQLGKSLAASEAARKEMETSHRALLNIMEDLEGARSSLEIKVKERTAALEEIKNSLEQKVSARTADLEASRKAIIHMMKDLKEDNEKLKIVDNLKTEFLSMVSHELRTPLTPIKGYLSLIMAGKMGEVTADQRKALGIIVRQSEHLHAMIDSVLDIARLEVGKPIPINKELLSIEPIIEQTVEAMQIQAQDKGITITKELIPPLPNIVGDEIKLKRVVANLIGNAIKFTPKDGQISIRATCENNQLRITIADNGIGLAKEHLDKIFDKFYQVDNSITRTAGGIGMGLSIAKELVEMHGGKIWAESDGLGKGTKVVLTLPVV